LYHIYNTLGSFKPNLSGLISGFIEFSFLREILLDFNLINLLINILISTT
jgi:hypothetical protein